MSSTESNAIDTLLLEERRYSPDEDFASQANATAEIYERLLLGHAEQYSASV
jgi:hypothetical protein